MIGTQEGYWFSYDFDERHPGGAVDMTVHECGDDVACARVPKADIFDVFDEVVASRRAFLLGLLR